MFRLTGKTHPGAVREHNEDAFYVDEAGGLAVVVDGMGGYAAGEVASDITVKSLEEINPSEHGLVAALVECHKRIIAHSQQHPESKGMGAAVVMAKLGRTQLSVCWAGDSRAYLFNRETGLRAVSRDHSYVQWLLSQGQITESEARNHPKRNLITQCLGLNAPQPELATVPWAPGEILLLCSDGLTDELDDEGIGRILNEASSANDCCVAAAEELISAALASGGNDNITVLLAENRFESDDTLVSPPTDPPRAFGATPWMPVLAGAGAAILVLLIGVLWQVYG